MVSKQVENSFPLDVIGKSKEALHGYSRQSDLYEDDEPIDYEVLYILERLGKAVEAALAADSESGAERV
jgi:hypothetical protein